MLESVKGSDSLSGVEGYQLEQEIDCLLRHVFDGLIRIDFSESWEGSFEFWDLIYARPIFFGWSAPELKYFENLVDFRITNEQWSLFIKLVKDASNSPGINS